MVQTTKRGFFLPSEKDRLLRDDAFTPSLRSVLFDNKVDVVRPASGSHTDLLEDGLLELPKESTLVEDAVPVTAHDAIVTFKRRLVMLAVIASRHQETRILRREDELRELTFLHVAPRVKLLAEHNQRREDADKHEISRSVVERQSRQGEH